MLNIKEKQGTYIKNSLIKLIDYRIMFMKNILLVSTLIIIISSCNFTKETIIDENLTSKLFYEHLKNGRSRGGLNGFGPIESRFRYEELVELKNFELLEIEQLQDNKHIVVFKFDEFYKIDSNSIRSKYSQGGLLKKYGLSIDDIIPSKEFKKNDHKTFVFSMIIKKYPSGIDVIGVGLPDKNYL